ncbi:MAG: hypothetical protein JNJ88_19045 [Planctomycetes bacterium]|nr:hypothetical protein [Planctomycetota bacterium]
MSASPKREAQGGEAPSQESDRRLVPLAWIASRWSCSRQTCRRILHRCGVRAVYLGGDARNATLRFDFKDVLVVEQRLQAS